MSSNFDPPEGSSEAGASSVPAAGGGSAVPAEVAEAQAQMMADLAALLAEVPDPAPALVAEVRAQAVERAADYGEDFGSLDPVEQARYMVSAAINMIPLAGDPDRLMALSKLEMQQRAIGWP